MPKTWLIEEKAWKVRCDSCEVLVINNIICHESGCPKAYLDEKRECKWCGGSFSPEDKYQNFCSEDCRESYHG